MTQEIVYWLGEERLRRLLPSAEDEVLPGLRWGDHTEAFTPAYWKSQYWMNELDQIESSPYSSRRGLQYEIAYCLLGGYGITTELSEAAFDACTRAGLIEDRSTDPEMWQVVLSKPLNVCGRTKRYRYPKTKSIYLAGAMQFLRDGRADTSSDLALRDSLMQISGVGPKIAGWITRNVMDSDGVAILDIHIVRAGRLAGLYTEKQRVEKHYKEMENLFIKFSKALSLRPAVLDCLIWDQMRILNHLAIECLEVRAGRKAKLQIHSSSIEPDTDQLELRICLSA